jgi:hypothetical protein
MGDRDLVMLTTEGRRVAGPLDKALVWISLSMRRWRLSGLWRSCHGLLDGVELGLVARST